MPTQSKYIERTEAITNAILTRIANGESLRHICDGRTMPSKETWRRWRKADPVLQKAYEEARFDQADEFFEEAIELARTSEDPAKGRLVCDMLRWACARMKPWAYGDRVQHANADGTGNQVTEVVYRWAEPEK